MAILGAAITSLLICQVAFPDFYQEMNRRTQAKAEKKKDKEPPQEKKKTEKQQPDEKGGPQNVKNRADGKIDVKENPTKGENEKKGPDEEKQKQKDDEEEKPSDPPLKFPTAFLFVVFGCDLFYSALAGFLCVWIAGFARYNHAMLLSLFLGVWKVQLLLGSAANQLPPTLLTIELIACPLVCLLGASLLREPTDDPYAEDQPSPESEH